MKSFFFCAITLIALGYMGCGTTNSSNATPMEQANAKELVVNGLNAIFTDFSEAEARKYFTKDYIQHNPNFPTGLEPIIGFLGPLQQAGTSIKIHRLLQDGELVVAHCTYNNAEAFGAKEVVTFDVFRVADGQIVEHWDAISPIVNETVSGRSQFDGPTTITDLDQTAKNKAIIGHFMEDILFGKNPGKITEYVSTEQYDQHNVAIADGLDGLGAALEYLAAQNDMFQYEKVHQVIGEGNFVFVRSEGMWHGKKQVFSDLFRLKDGLIVEHWDVIQEVPAEMAHSNGMF